MNKVLLAMIAILLALTAVPVVYAEDTNEIVTDEMPADDGANQELPPLTDPASADESGGQ